MGFKPAPMMPPRPLPSAPRGFDAAHAYWMEYYKHFPRAQRQQSLAESLVTTITEFCEECRLAWWSLVDNWQSGTVPHA